MIDLPGAGTFIFLAIALHLAVVAMISLCMALSQRIWVGLVALAAGIWLTAAMQLSAVWTILLGTLLLLIFWGAGREPGTGLLKERARWVAFIIAIGGLLPILILNWLLP